jgi:acyl-CoA dehydrogenase
LGSEGFFLTQTDAIYPQSFSVAQSTGGAEIYTQDDAVRTLIAFFEAKGVRALKEEDRREAWYDDWLEYQAKHRLYANLLSPKAFSPDADGFDLLRLARFLEVFGYFSPAHGYSLQVTFLGFFAILMGSNEALKKETVAALADGKLFAFGISEKDHGADLLANVFTIHECSPGQFVANGSKYYIGNANCASMISILGRRKKNLQESITRRDPMILFALRRGPSQKLLNLQKIQTLGVRAAFVGGFDVKDYVFSSADIIAEGRKAWDALFGTVTLGKIFLGFGSIGICEHALVEATTHLRSRILYDEPATQMPHLRLLLCQAYVRLAAMKLFAYRALDFVHAATADDRRYQLFCAVQKARVSTEGVKVMAALSECIGAKAFEADGYFEMALRDIQLIPSLEGSTHINLAMASQFIPRYFRSSASPLKNPPSLVAGTMPRGENRYLMSARCGRINGIEFPNFLDAYRPLMDVPNVRLFARQAKVIQLALRDDSWRGASDDLQFAIGLGQCVSTIVYGQLIAEHAVLLNVPAEMVSAIFHLLVLDLNATLTSLVSSQSRFVTDRTLVRQFRSVPQFRESDWRFVFDQLP